MTKAMTEMLSAADLIERKYAEDGADTVHTYQSLHFDKHLRLLKQTWV